MGNELIPFSDIERMAATIAKSGFFGVKTAEGAAALMLVAQAEGRHPASVAMEYNIIQDRPALKAEAMLARFQNAGGVVEWVTLTDQKVSAKFHHPQSCPHPVLIDWDMARATVAGVGGKDIWKKYPRQMLRARVISEGVRTCYPSVIGGFYTPEEVQDFDAPKESPNPVKVEVKPATEKPKASIMPEEPEAFGAVNPIGTATHAASDAELDAFAKETFPEPGDAPEAAGPPAEPPTATLPDAEKISEKQAKRLFAIAKGAGKTHDEIKAVLGEYGYEHSRDVKRVAYEEIVSRLDKKA